MHTCNVDMHMFMSMGVLMDVGDKKCELSNHLCLLILIDFGPSQTMLRVPLTQSDFVISEWYRKPLKHCLVADLSAIWGVQMCTTHFFAQN